MMDSLVYLKYKSLKRKRESGNRRVSIPGMKVTNLIMVAPAPVKCPKTYRCTKTISLMEHVASILLLTR